MSFILDALRKSEHARQSLGNATLAELPLGRRSRGQPWWIVGIAVLLVINLAVLLLVLFRDNKAPAINPQQMVAEPARVAAPTVAPTVSVPAAASRPLEQEAEPPQFQIDTVPRGETPLADLAPDEPALVKRIEPQVAMATTANGLPELRIDMHVYAPKPADRFVFINMHKYGEGQTTAEGPRVDEITPDGVILFYKGQQLRLQRP